MGTRLIARAKTVIWLGAVLVALAVMPCLLRRVERLGAGADLLLACLLFRSKGRCSSRLPTDLFPADRVATVWGVFGAVGSLGGSLLGLLAGFLIQERRL